MYEYIFFDKSVIHKRILLSNFKAIGDLTFYNAVYNIRNIRTKATG